MSAFVALLDGFTAHDRRYRAGHTLFRTGDTVRQIFLIDKGEAHLVRYQAGGGRTVLQRAVIGDLLAEASLFSPAYHCDGVAAAEVQVRCIAVEHIRARMEVDASFARACAEHLAHQVQHMRVRSEILGMRTVGDRLDAWLSVSSAPPKGGWTSVAAQIGVSREALYRELSRRRRVSRSDLT